MTCLAAGRWEQRVSACMCKCWLQAIMLSTPYPVFLCSPCLQAAFRWDEGGRSVVVHIAYVGQLPMRGAQLAVSCVWNVPFTHVPALPCPALPGAYVTGTAWIGVLLGGGALSLARLANPDPHSAMNAGERLCRCGMHVCGCCAASAHRTAVMWGVDFTRIAQSL